MSEQKTETAQKPRGRWSVWRTFVIGRQDNPMMKRIRVVQTPLFGVYLHAIYREDMDPVPHDHPWNFWRLVLWGGYVEEYADVPRSAEHRLQMIQPLRPSCVPVEHAHRIVMVKPRTWTLIVVGRKRRTWGFWRPEQGIRNIAGPGRTPVTCWGVVGARWVDYREYLGISTPPAQTSQDGAR